MGGRPYFRRPRRPQPCFQENYKVEDSVVARASCPCATAKMAVLQRTLQYSGLFSALLDTIRAWQ
jgi:hypothetical protein